MILSGEGEVFSGEVYKGTMVVMLWEGQLSGYSVSGGGSRYDCHFASLVLVIVVCPWRQKLVFVTTFSVIINLDFGGEVLGEGRRWLRVSV